jgi:membrane protein implicated in regulation of membrane protease activity
MDDWVLWAIAAAVFAVGETMTMALVLAPIAGGAVLASVAALAGASEAVQWILFLVVSIGLTLVARPIARSHRNMPAQLRTGTAALVGKPAVVLERISNDEAVGCVRIDGEVWTARAYDEDRTFDVGERVQVLEIRGATALVSD